MMMNDVDDDRGENAIEKERRRQLEFRRQVDSNDPNLLCACVGESDSEGFRHNYYVPHDN
jgi:hypothetical protein